MPEIRGQLAIYDSHDIKTSGAGQLVLLEIKGFIQSDPASYQGTGAPAVVFPFILRDEGGTSQTKLRFSLQFEYVTEIVIDRTQTVHEVTFRPFDIRNGFTQNGFFFGVDVQVFAQKRDGPNAVRAQRIVHEKPKVYRQIPDLNAGVDIICRLLNKAGWSAESHTGKLVVEQVKKKT
jgi:hypothetical protein